MQHYCNFVGLPRMPFNCVLMNDTSLAYILPLKQKIIDLLDIEQCLKFKPLYLD